MDDGSTDSGPELVQKTGDVSTIPIRLISQKNLGQAAARNHGLSLAREDFVAFLDADDLWWPEKLERQFSLLRSTPAAATTCAYSLFYEKSFKSRAFYFDWSAGALKAWSLAYGVGPALMSTLLIRRNLAQALHGFREDMSVFTDLDFSLRLRNEALVVAYPEVLVKYRQHDHQIHRSSATLLIEADFFGKQHLSPREAAELNKHITLLQRLRRIQSEPRTILKIVIAMREFENWSGIVRLAVQRLYHRTRQRVLLFRYSHQIP